MQIFVFFKNWTLLISHDASRQTLRNQVHKMADLDRWIEIAKECKYLPEHDLKVFYSNLKCF